MTARCSPSLLVVTKELLFENTEQSAKRVFLPPRPSDGQSATVNIWSLKRQRLLQALRVSYSVCLGRRMRKEKMKVSPLWMPVPQAQSFPPLIRVRRQASLLHGPPHPSSVGALAFYCMLKSPRYMDSSAQVISYRHCSREVVK